MKSVHSVEEVRRAEAAVMATQAEGELMGRAAGGLAATCARLLGRVYGRRVVLLVGSGNNGGDALFAGASLARRGARVDALLLSDKVHEPGLDALRKAGGRTSPATGSLGALDTADLVLDGILGIGGRGGLRPDAARVVTHAEASDATLVAVDVPSGVDADTGAVAGAAVHADVTVTFGTLKPGLVCDPGAAHAGLVELLDIGLGDALGAPVAQVPDALDVAAALPKVGRESDKYSRGVVGMVSGSDEYPGAAVLSTGGAVLGGAGMVRFSGPDVPSDLVRRRWPESVPGEGRVQSWVVGPGLGRDDDARRRLVNVLDAPEPAVIDADGLTLLGELVADGRPTRAAPTLLTPHAGELARLLDVERAEVEAHRMRYAREAAQRYSAVVLLKGSTTVVMAPDGVCRVVAAGTPWLATAGSGDVLSGLIGALLGGGLDPLTAGAAGAWIHGTAGRLASGDLDGTGQAGHPVPADAVVEAVSRALTLARAGVEPGTLGESGE